MIIDGVQCWVKWAELVAVRERMRVARMGVEKWVGVGGGVMVEEMMRVAVEMREKQGMEVVVRWWGQKGWWREWCGGWMRGCWGGLVGEVGGSR